ncbi:hypothetical protein TNCV_3089311 [Trichonephila clavipes]|nr:hypothetical protein TNCV_3089311 [Trichonephila clavipes]
MLWGGKLLSRNYPPTNKNTLIRALTEEWDKLPQQLLNNVVHNIILTCGMLNHTPRWTYRLLIPLFQVPADFRCFVPFLRSCRHKTPHSLTRSISPPQSAGWSNRRIGRHLGQSDMVVARCWQQWIIEGGEGSVPSAEGQDVPGTQMIARIVQSEDSPLRHQQRR